MNKALFILSGTLLLSTAILSADYEDCPMCGSNGQGQERIINSGRSGGGGSDSSLNASERASYYNSDRNVFGEDRDDNYRERNRSLETRRGGGGGSRDIWGDRAGDNR
jgi:hypothetical protein